LLGALRANDQAAVLRLPGGKAAPDATAPCALSWSSLLPGIETHRFSGYTSYLAAGTRKAWAAARAIDILASVVLSTEMRLVPREPGAPKSGASLRPPPDLLRLLQNPNPYDTISELLYLWVAHMKFTGNAFWLKDEMDELGRPKSIYALNPAGMKIVPDRARRVREYRYRVNGETIAFAPEEIIHFRRPHAGDPLWGLGEIESAESLYDDHINRALYHQRFMANGAMPSAVLVKDEWEKSQEEWEHYKASFAEQYGGAKNAGKVAWLSGKWSLLQMGIDAQKMQELEKSKRTVEEIFLNHGVPLSVAGFGSANFATAQVEERAMKRYSVLPLVNWFVDVMNSPRGFITAFTKDLRLDFPLTGLIDVEQVMKEHAPLFDRGGLTPNELRELAGLPRVSHPLLDQFFVHQQYVPLEIAGILPPTDAALAAAAGTNTSDGKPAGQKLVVELQTNGAPAGSVQATAKENRVILEMPALNRPPAAGPRRVAVRKTAAGYELSELRSEPESEPRKHDATIELRPR
jgi:HK97 family phage portal protein